jgi:uncharacterized membrane protein YoaK (UPF0700 family)
MSTHMNAVSQSHEDRLLCALALLTFATGLVDAASVLRLGHVFTANMTGNIVFLGFSLAGAGQVASSDCAVALGAFLIGAMTGGRLAARSVSFRSTMFLETGLIVAASAIGWIVRDAAPVRVPQIALLALATGIQNAAVRKLGVLDFTTTVLTLTLTGLAADSSLAGGSNPRVLRRLASVVVMLLGAFTGALLSRHGVRWTIGCAALFLVGVCVLLPGVSHSASRSAAPAVGPTS